MIRVSRGSICGRFRWASTWASAGHPGGIRGPFWGIHIKSVSGSLGFPTLLALQNVPEFPFYKIKKGEMASFCGVHGFGGARMAGGWRGDLEFYSGALARCSLRQARCDEPETRPGMSAAPVPGLVSGLTESRIGICETCTGKLIDETIKP